MPKTLTAHEQPISRIFSDDYVFQIPGYQRPYAWTDEQARELFDDLVDFLDSNPIEVSEMPPYFLGSIVLIKDDTGPDADVIDGQQRLTTLTLLLSAIRASVALADAKDITPLIYERGNVVRGTRDRFRLTLRERDKEFFQRYVQHEDGFSQLLTLGEPETDSQRNLRNNAILFRAKLAEFAEAKRLKLAQFVVTRCLLVVVQTPDLDAAYRIFSVLNSRGLELSATDILKAEIIGAIPEELRAHYTEKWEDAEEDLGRESFSDLFSHIRMIHRKTKPKGTLLREFRDHVPEIRKPAYFIDHVLEPMARAFGEISDAAYSSTEHAGQVNRALRWLNRLEFKDWMPPALAFASQNRGDPALMLRFFDDLESLSYAMLISRFGVNERIDRFARVTSWLEQRADLWSSASPLQLSDKERKATLAKLDGPVYEYLSARARTALVLRLDELLSDGTATYDFENVSIEHVLPQDPREGSDWIKSFPDPVERDRLTHRLGNLALLARRKNSAASNYEFIKKKETYFAREGISPFVLTTQVLREPAWTPSVVLRRQSELISTLARRWRLSEVTV